MENNNTIPRYPGPGAPPATAAAMLRNISGGAASNANPAAPWMNPMSMNVNAMNAMNMNPLQQQQQHQPQDVFTQQQMANLVNSGINPMSLSSQQHHQKLQMMQLHQRMEQQQQRGRGGINVIEQSLQQQTQQHRSPPPLNNLIQHQDQSSQQLMQFQMKMQQRESRSCVNFPPIVC